MGGSIYDGSLLFTDTQLQLSSIHSSLSILKHTNTVIVLLQGRHYPHATAVSSVKTAFQQLYGPPTTRPLGTSDVRWKIFRFKFFREIFRFKIFREIFITTIG
jgi:hypothetical protein